MELIDEAVAARARREKACEVLGITIRTAQRWRSSGSDSVEEDKRKNTPHPNTPKKLSEEEEDEIIKSSYLKGVHRQEPVPDSSGTCRQRHIPCIRIDHLQDTQEKRDAEAQGQKPQVDCKKAGAMCGNSAQPGMVLGHNLSQDNDMRGVFLSLHVP